MLGNIVLEYQPRTYRDYRDAGRFCTFRVTVETTDLYVKALRRLERETEELVRECRGQIEAAIARRPEFLSSLTPLEEDPRDSPAAMRMIRAAIKAGVGPMAAVAGAVAEFVGRALLALSPEIIIENGGDIFARVDTPFVCGLFAGASPFSNRVGLKIEPTGLPVGNLYVVRDGRALAVVWQGGRRGGGFIRRGPCRRGGDCVGESYSRACGSPQGS